MTINLSSWAAALGQRSRPRVGRGGEEEPGSKMERRGREVRQGKAGREEDGVICGMLTARVREI